MDQEEKHTQQEQSSGLWAAGIFFVALVFLLIVLGGYVQDWEWTGLSPPEDRTFWDWLDLLIVPAVLAIGGYLFTRSETQRTLEDANLQRALDREIADERRQDDMLRAYLDEMSRLLTDKDRPLHRANPGDSLSTVARARTLTVLGRLDSGRKRSVLQFLLESGLIYKGHTLLHKGHPKEHLIERRHNIVRLTQADVSGAVLREANLARADLREANLVWADLSGVNLSNADLRGANLYLDPRETKANLTEADLTGANLEAAAIFEDQLTKVKSLKGATMPNGQKYEDWIKDREQ